MTEHYGLYEAALHKGTVETCKYCISSEFTASELEPIVTEWGDFARAKCFVFRAVTPEAFALYWPAFARGVIARSKVAVVRDSDDIDAWAVIEDVPDSEAKILHCCYTARPLRNHGIMRTLLAANGITKESKVLVTMLTVLGEKMIEKFGWIYSPFAILKE